MDVDKNLDGVCATKNCDNPINLNAKICVHCLKEKYNKILEGKSREYEEWPNPPKNNEFNFKQFMFTSIIFMSLIMFLSSIVWYLAASVLGSLDEDFGAIWDLCVFSILLFFAGAFFHDSSEATWERSAQTNWAEKTNKVKDSGDLSEGNNPKIRCSRCKRIKCICITVEIIGSCRRCGRNLTRSNSIGIDGDCMSCYDHGEDI